MRLRPARGDCGRTPLVFGASDPYVLFVGSAISVWRPSNAPSATGMKDAAIRALEQLYGLSGVVRLDVSSILGPSPRLEWVMEELWEYLGDSTLDLLSIYDRGRPNGLHLYIARQFMAGRIRRIYTTNQDTFIERALSVLGWEVGDQYAVILPGEEAHSVHASRPCLLKLHGSTANPASVRTTLRHVGLGLPSQLHEALLSDLNREAFCFVGYSGLDIDIRPVLSESNPRCIHWYERPGADVTHHFASLLESRGKDVRVEALDIAQPPAPSPYARLTMAAPCDTALDARINDILTHELAVTPVDAAFVLSRLFRLGNNQGQRELCLSFCLANLGRLREAWRVHYDLGAISLFQAKGLVKPVRALRDSSVAAQLALKAGHLYGYAKARIGMGSAIDMLFHGECSVVSAASLCGVYLPLLRKMPFASLSEDDNAFLLYEALFRVGRAYTKLKRRGRAKRVLGALLRAAPGPRDYRGHAARFLASIYSEEGKYREAEHLLAIAREEFVYREMDVELADVARGEAELCVRQGDLDLARHKAIGAIRTYRSRPNPRGIAKARRLLVRIRKARSRR